MIPVAMLLVIGHHQEDINHVIVLHLEVINHVIREIIEVIDIMSRVTWGVMMIETLEVETLEIETEGIMTETETPSNVEIHETHG